MCVKADMQHIDEQAIIRVGLVGVGNGDDMATCRSSSSCQILKSRRSQVGGKKSDLIWQKTHRSPKSGPRLVMMKAPG
jgi:hypothetical protein